MHPKFPNQLKCIDFMKGVRNYYNYGPQIFPKNWSSMWYVLKIVSKPEYDSHKTEICKSKHVTTIMIFYDAV